MQRRMRNSAAHSRKLGEGVLVEEEGFGLSGGYVKKTRKEAGEAESCLSAASSFRAAESMVFSPRHVSLDFFDSFLSRKKNILMIV